MDGKEEKRYAGIANLVFSLDSKRLAYVALMGKRYGMIVDGKEEKQYDYILTPPIFSPDSMHVVYAIKNGKKERVVVDGREEKYSGWKVRIQNESRAYLSTLRNLSVENILMLVFCLWDKEYDTIVTFDGGNIVFDSSANLHYFAIRHGNIYLVEEDISTETTELPRQPTDG